jgi:hypothetical protein
VNIRAYTSLRWLALNANGRTKPLKASVDQPPRLAVKPSITQLNNWSPKSGIAGVPKAKDDSLVVPEPQMRDL